MRQEHEPKAWLGLAAGALGAAGLLALVLAASRAPGAENWLPSGPDFFKKGLVTHVVFSFQVWLLAMLAALAARVAPAATRAGALIPLAAASLGCVLLLVPTLAGWGRASLNNYVPVLIHPLFYAGLGLVAAGVAAVAIRPLMVWRSLDTVGFAIACAGLTLVAALVCFGLAAADPGLGDDSVTANERLFWGGGHILQFVNAQLAMIGWLVAAGRAFGRAPPFPGLIRLCFAALALAAWIGPVLEATHASDDLALRQAFTSLFHWVLPAPPAMVMMIAVWPLIVRGPKVGDVVAGRALLLSLAVFGLGGLAGFALGEGDTRTPSHYHAMIGGVNLALMGLIHLWLLPLAPSRWLTAQYWLYGGGQLLHAAGFYLAGLAGVARKTAGAAQGLDSVVKLAAMAIVGIGGAIAVVGGVIFVVGLMARLGAQPSQRADIVDSH
ncbi:putative Permease [Magnetospirillum sp. LM-5]|uniref:cbb3-type cytochrome c oxidase subunit I n=1 Tax=Magnetospirillum sp. LM-5 TaxID=2681466 RepID=UPI00137C9BC4|nr:cbb3-type cytochrome c oxidase subunit I [Magnetospirillum sp. LM-5]CAA7611356.1 putative Permease [Magnetospirillum sp. LM-5]